MNKTLQQLLFIALLLLGSHNLVTAQNNVGVGTRTPNPNSILELFSANKGFLQPRVELVSTSNPSPLTQHVVGMRVYNTIARNDVTPGEYYNDGQRWNKVQTAGSKQDLEKILNATFSIEDGQTGARALSGLSFTARYKGTYLLLVKEFFQIAVTPGADFINWYTNVFKNNTPYKNNECYITLSPNSNYVTHIDFFIADLEVGDNIRVEILKPFQPHKLFVAVSGLFPRTSLTVVKIF